MLDDLNSQLVSFDVSNWLLPILHPRYYTIKKKKKKKVIFYNYHLICAWIVLSF